MRAASAHVIAMFTGFMRHCGSPSHGLGGAEHHRTT
jgi:hypothetical protein